MNKIENGFNQSGAIKTSKSGKKPLVSVVLPAYNEANIIENNLSILCQYLKTLENEYCWEIIIVNDGSTDETGAIAEAFAEEMENVHVLHHMFNFRLGQALQYAFKICKGDYIVVLDIDLSYSPFHIEKMLSKIRESRAKIVIASPYTRGGKVSNVPLTRRLLSAWANKFLCFFAKRDWFSDKLTNITGMVRTYDGLFLRNLNLKSMDMEINHEIISKSKILHARIVEIPAHLEWKHEDTETKIKDKSKCRKSNMRIMRAIAQSMMSGYIFRPFMFFIMPGFAILIFSIYTLFWAFIHFINLYQKVVYPGTSTDDRISEAIGQAFLQYPHTFIVGGISLMVAIQLISFGFIALQNKRYYDELFHLSSHIYKKNRSKENIEIT